MIAVRLRHVLADFVLFAALAGLSAPTDLAAQIRASERGTISQVVDGTTIVVDYARPRARGRSPLFGNVVRRDEMWTPGANWATTFEFDADVRLDGHEVPAGRYSVWMIPGEEEWRVHLHEEAELFHTQPPDPAEAFLAWEVTPVEAEPMEVLTFAFPEIRRDGATLEFGWGTTRIPIDVAVSPSRAAVALAEEDVAPYLGAYSLGMEGGPEGAPPMDLEVVLRDGRLLALVNQGMFTMELIPTGESHEFWPAFLDDEGEVVDVEQFPVTFQMEGGRASGFTAPGVEEGSVWMSATRKDEAPGG